MRPWDTVREGHFPHFSYFVGGISNPTLNLIDRHLARGAGNRLALIWEGEDGQSRFFTYRMLAIEVNRCANVLKQLGVGKGDAVAIFTPNLREAVVAVLACFRIGALFNTVFSGFSARSLRDRLESYAPKVVITADGGLRRGRDRAAQGDRRRGDRGAAPASRPSWSSGAPAAASPMREGRDHWWHELMASARPRVCAPSRWRPTSPASCSTRAARPASPRASSIPAIAFVVNNYVYAKYHLDHHPDDVLWCTADIGWLTMHIWGIVGALANGVTTVVFEGALDYPTPDRFYQIVERYRVNKMFTAPTAIRMLMKYGDDLMAPYDLSSLDVVAVVGEPFNPEAWHWTYETLGRGRDLRQQHLGTDRAVRLSAGRRGLAHADEARLVRPDVPRRRSRHRGRRGPAGRRRTSSGNLVIRRPFPMMLRGSGRSRSATSAATSRRCPAATSPTTRRSATTTATSG